MERSIQFDEEDCLFKREIAEIKESKEEYEEAAKILESINLRDGSTKLMDKVDIWLLIADNWFEADESVNSEKYINLAAH